MQRNPQAARQSLDDTGPLVPFRRGIEIDVGDLSGDEVEPIIATFGYFGDTYRVNPNLTETMVVDLLEAGESIGVEDPRQLVAAKQYVRDHIHPDDFDDFWATAVEHRQGVQAVIKVCWKILEQVTARPTTPPSDSSDGRRDTPTNSPVGASGPVIESTAVPAQPPVGGNLSDVAEHFITKFESQGRPDLALQVVLAKETREARGLVTV
jgi:hypothetical protein